jgi:hypothetical protein
LAAETEGIHVEAAYFPEIREVSSAFSNSRETNEGKEATVPIDGAAVERIASDTKVRLSEQQKDSDQQRIVLLTKENEDQKIKLKKAHAINHQSASKLHEVREILLISKSDGKKEQAELNASIQKLSEEKTTLEQKNLGLESELKASHSIVENYREKFYSLQQKSAIQHQRDLAAKNAEIDRLSGLLVTAENNRRIDEALVSRVNTINEELRRDADIKAKDQVCSRLLTPKASKEISSSTASNACNSNGAEVKQANVAVTYETNGGLANKMKSGIIRFLICLGPTDEEKKIAARAAECKINKKMDDLLGLQLEPSIDQTRGLKTSEDPTKRTEERSGLKPERKEKKISFETHAAAALTSDIGGRRQTQPMKNTGRRTSDRGGDQGIRSSAADWTSIGAMSSQNISNGGLANIKTSGITRLLMYRSEDDKGRENRNSSSGKQHGKQC